MITIKWPMEMIKKIQKMKFFTIFFLVLLSDSQTTYEVVMTGKGTTK